MSHQQIIQPDEIDVLCGRGGASNNHVGNQMYLRVVQMNKDMYKQIPNKKHKHFLAESIVRAVEDTGARFLCFDKSTKTWVKIPPQKAISKTLQALRERKVGASLRCPKALEAVECLLEKKWQQKSQQKQQQKETQKSAEFKSLSPEPLGMEENQDPLQSKPTAAPAVSRSVTPEIEFQLYGKRNIEHDVVKICVSDDSSASSNDTFTPSQQYDGFDLFADWNDDDVDVLEATFLPLDVEL